MRQAIVGAPRRGPRGVGEWPFRPRALLTAARDAGAYAAQIGADAHLAKPFRVRDLVELVRQFSG